MALFSYPVCTWLCQYVNMGVRKWLEKSAEKQKYKMRKTANPLSRKAFRAVSFSATKDKWMRVGVLNSFLGLSNAPALVLWEKALLFQAFSFLMHSPVINIAKTKGAGFVVEKRKIPSFEPLVQISLSALFFAHGAIRTHPVSYS